MKLKIRSSLRTKKRYLLIKAKGRDSIETAILDYTGVLGWAKASPIFVKSDEDKHIIAVNREELENIKAALEISKDEINLMRVSGTLKGLAKK